MRVALVTAAAAASLDEDLPPLRAALSRLGVESVIAVWDDPAVRWSELDLAVLRSTWDYPPRRDEFVAWARALPVPLLNPPEVIAWNTDKRYLLELEARGVPITPTVLVEPGRASGLALAIERALSRGRECVVKPAISAGAKDTARYGRDEREQAEVHGRRLLAADRPTLVQPYLEAVDTHGETALLFFDGVFSHAIRKGPILVPGKAYVDGLYAREEITSRAPSTEELEVGEAALAAVPAGRDALLYARVDLAPGPDGAPVLLELELAEPSVFLDHGEGAADRMARAIVERAGRGAPG